MTNTRNERATNRKTAYMLDDRIVIANGLDFTASRLEFNKTTGLILNQTLTTSREYKSGGVDYRIKVEIRFDDECNNGHETFAITGNIDELSKNGRWREHSGGCIHDDIVKRFPTLKHLIKWHLVSTDAPFYCTENTIYHASNRDYNGLLAGEPNLNPVHIGHGVKFDNVPIEHKLNRHFAQFLKERHKTGDFKIVSIAHEKKAGDTYDFSPKWTLAGYGEKWHDCPFDTQNEAQRFADALNKCKVEFVEFHTVFGKGKERDFKAARSCALWPEATDEQLSLPKDELHALLLARAPALMADFKRDMLAAGLVYPDVEKFKAVNHG